MMMSYMDTGFSFCYCTLPYKNLRMHSECPRQSPSSAAWMLPIQEVPHFPFWISCSSSSAHALCWVWLRELDIAVLRHFYNKQTIVYYPLDYW